MKKLIALIGISLLTMFAIGKAEAVVYCPPTIYCPDTRSADCLIPPNWSYRAGTIEHAGTMAFSYADSSNVNIGECLYYPMNIDSNPKENIVAIEYNNNVVPDTQIPANKWSGILCYSALHPESCPYKLLP